MLAQFILPLADGTGTIIAIVGMVISFVVWAVQQANTKGKQEEQKRRQAQVAQQHRQRQQQQQPRRSQEDEVDAFLRSAAQQNPSQQRPRSQRPPARPPQRPGPAAAPLPSSRPPARPAQSHSSQSQSQQRSAQMRSTSPPGQRRPQAPPPTARPNYDGLETSNFDASAASMGHLEGHEDDVDKHVHDVFDHDLSSLDNTLDARDLDTFGDTSLLDADLHPRAAAAGAQPASGIEDSIVEMFRNPANIRNAIVMQEVLRRPSF